VKPLEGLRVLDLSRVLSGPYCTMILGDFGAEVIKVEEPRLGDETRGWLPPAVGDQAAYFLSVNRNKRSITLDLKSPEGLKVVHELARNADVVVENFRPGTAARLGVGYQDLSALNPRLIYLSISGFGQTGPYKHKPGYDAIAQAMGGLMNATGYPDLPPVRFGVAVADIGAGMWGVIGILTALSVRERTGRGQWIDTSLLESQLSWLTYVAGNYFATGRVPARQGSAHPNIVPYQAFETKDGYVMVAVGNDNLWRRFARVIGLDELADDPRFATNRDRVENREVLLGSIGKAFKTRTTAAWIELLEAEGIPVGPINSVEDVVNDPYVAAREMIVALEHPSAGTIHVTGIPVKFSETPGAIESPPPLLGEHTEEVLLELGYSLEEISTLREKGAI
jgi:crotonobetainyl-CoA:carnitine CoA-transferase CaiB-like acyl-CoA transferase